MFGGRQPGLEFLYGLPSAVVVMDPEGRITGLNTAAERLLDSSPELAIGRGYPEVFGPSLADRTVRLFLRLARTHQRGTPLMVEATLPGGRRARLQANVGPLQDEAGQLVGILFAADDRSEEEATRTELQQHAARAERLQGALQRYMGEAVAAAIDDRPSLTQLGGARQVISVLHADVRGYTTIAEELSPEAVVELLVRYHGAAVGALQAESGTLDRFIGDAVLAMWNAPRPQEEHTRKAIRGALAMRDATQAVGSEVAYGVGVHTGEAVVGNIGSAQYMNYTAIGDTVNVAARLQAAAAAGEVVCSAAALEAAGPGVGAVPLGALTVKGRKGTVEAFRVEGIEE